MGKMENHTEPLSPAPSQQPAINDLEHGMEQLAQYNAAALSLPAEASTPVANHDTRYTSEPRSTRYASPAMTPFEHGSPVPATPPYYGSSSLYPEPPSHYPPIGSTQSSPLPSYSAPAAKSSTSTPSPGRTLRSGRTNTTASSPLGPVSTGVQKPASKPRPKPRSKKNRRKAGDGPSPDLPAPLSILLKEITSVTDTDVGKYVHRSIEQRRAEVDNSKDKKVKRPMNAFMLYRKAHQNRVKVRWSHDNHQIVSKVCGQSWSMEPEEIQDQFNDWARIERENHARAFPTYKFTPARPTKGVKKRVDSDDEDEFDPVFDPRDHLSLTYNAYEPSYSRQSSLEAAAAPPIDSYGHYHRSVSRGSAATPMQMSHYLHSNRGRPLPEQYHAGVTNGYIRNGPSIKTQNMLGPYDAIEVENLHWYPSPAPGMYPAAPRSYHHYHHASPPMDDGYVMYAPPPPAATARHIPHSQSPPQHHAYPDFDQSHPYLETAAAGGPPDYGNRLQIYSTHDFSPSGAAAYDTHFLDGADFVVGVPGLDDGKDFDAGSYVGSVNPHVGLPSDMLDPGLRDSDDLFGTEDDVNKLLDTRDTPEP